MPCMITGASDGIAPAWFGDEQRAAGSREVLEAFPLGAEPVPVDRVVEPPGQGAEVLAAAPMVDIGTPSRVDVVVGLLDLGVGHLHQFPAR